MMLRMPFAMAAGLSAVFALSSVVPAQAMPIAPLKIERQQQAEIVQVQSKQKIRRNQRFKRQGNFKRRYSNNRRYYNRGGYNRRHFNNRRYYSNRRHYRPAYRAGFWRPGPAVVIKVRPGQRVGNRHIRWCNNRYVSYRVSDNSFKPYNGPRRQCVSPFRG